MSTSLPLTADHLAAIHRQGIRGILLTVYLSINALNPFGDRNLSITQRKLADDLGVHPSTICRALGKLANLGLITKQITLAHTNLKMCNAIDQHAPTVADVHRRLQLDQLQLQTCNLQAPELITCNDSEASNTFKTDQETLSVQGSAKNVLKKWRRPKIGQEWSESKNLPTQALQNSHVPPPAGTVENFSENNAEFKNWLLRRAQRLGKTDPLSWALVVLESPDPQLRLEFERSSLSLPVSLPISPSVAIEPQDEEAKRGEKLRWLQAAWDSGWVKLRDRVRRECEALGFGLRDSGPFELEF
jgi:Crp-like helix-turn-helix domain